MKHSPGIALVFLGITLAGCAGGLRIVDRPVSFTDARIRMTREYLADRYGLDGSTIRIQPRIVVLHWTAIATLEDSWGAFAAESLPSSRPELTGAGALNIGIHFLVDRDGTVYRLMPETWMARHTIGLNHTAIGVENVGGAGSVDDMTDAQIEANARLVRYLKEKYPSIDYLIGHHEYTLFEGHDLWLERDPEYRTVKVDPGERFMSAVRVRVDDLGLRGPVEIEAEISR